MKFWEVVRFEISYQTRRPWTWLYFVVLFALTFQIGTEAYSGNARAGGYYFNAPYIIAALTLIGTAMSLVVTAAFAGEAGARDVQTGMHPLVYSSPVGKVTYLGGRLLAAFALNALILIAVPAAILLTAIVPGVDRDLIGPYHPGAYVESFLVLGLSNAFVATALLFAMAALSRRAITSYLGAVILFFGAMFAWQFVAGRFGQWELAKIIDPLGLTVLSEISRTTTPAQKNALSIATFEWLLLNRAVWLGIALVVLAVTHFRFRFEHAGTASRWWRRRAAASEPELVAPRKPIVIPKSRRTFGPATHLRQMLAITAQSFREIAMSWGGFVLAALTTILILFGPGSMNHMGVPLIPSTQRMTAFAGSTGEITWLIVPLLTVFYVGELVWRERETGLSEIADAAPAPEWVRFLGRFVGLALVLAAYQTALIVACLLIQTQLGYYDFELGLYARVFLGLMLADHLLYAALAFVVHVMVNQKYAGHMVVLIASGFTAFAATFGIEHKLLVYGNAPGWTYTDLRGFGADIAPWAWFKLYWAGWALLLAVVAKLFWIRTREQGFATRLQLARRRLTRPTLGVAAAAAVLVLVTGGFSFYNTNVLNAYVTNAERTAQRIEYERRYERHKHAPKPQLTGASLRVELYPDRREAEIRGTFRLVNTSGVVIDSIHVAPDWEAETGPVEFDRRASLVLDDSALGHRIYALETPLVPGDSLRLSFVVRIKPRGFTNDGVDPTVVANSTFLETNEWLPAIGYQTNREIAGAGARKEHGLPPRPVRSLDDADARRDMTRSERIVLETIVGTAEGQTAVAPGALRRTWSENGRRYFHYATDVPIQNDVVIYSANYTVHEAKWNDVAIQIFHHPDHAANADRMAKSVQASLEYLTKHFGPYPHRQIRLVEYPENGVSLHAAPINISYQEGFSLLNPDADSRQIDFVFAVVAHEIAHQWWGGQLTPARVEGGALLSESLAWYSALSVVQATYGDDHLRRLLDMMRETYMAPRPAAGVPLLRANDWILAYRKGPFAMYTLREYLGADSVNAALRRLMDKHRAGAPPLATSRDLYRELQSVTPDSLRYLLSDLFETNTYWEVATRRVTAEATEEGSWRVMLDVRARKVVVDTIGNVTGVPMNDIVEVGVYAPGGESLYLRGHRVRAGDQRITVTVPKQPGRAGIDPRNLLIDTRTNDNVRDVTNERVTP